MTTYFFCLLIHLIITKFQNFPYGYGIFWCRLERKNLDFRFVTLRYDKAHTITLLPNHDKEERHRQSKARDSNQKT